MDKNLTVAQKYDIDEYLLSSLADSEKKGDFFKSSLKFYRFVKEKSYKDISTKQKKWLKKIETITQERSKKIIQKNVQERKIKKFFTIIPKKTKDGWVWGTYFDYEEP